MTQGSSGLHQVEIDFVKAGSESIDRPEEFAQLLVQPQEISKGNSSDSSISVPGHEAIRSLNIEETLILNREWLQKFEENRPTYQEQLKSVHETWVAQGKEFASIMKPGEPDGLEARENNALESVGEKRDIVEDQLNKMSGRRRIDAADLANDYVSSSDPQKKLEIAAKLGAMGLGHLIKPISDLSKANDELLPIQDSANRARSDLFDVTLACKDSVRIYQEGLEKLAKLKPQKDMPDELAELRDKSIALDDMSLSLLNYPQLREKIQVDPLEPGELLDA